MANRNVPVRRNNRNNAYSLLLLVASSLIDYSHSLQILSTAQALLLSAPSFQTAQSPSTTSKPPSSSKSKSSYYSSSTTPSSSSSPSSASPSSVYDVPALQLSAAAARIANGVYLPRDPEDIPPGFARMCGRAGGFAPRPAWDSITNGVTPWFEQQGRGGGTGCCHVWYNADEGRWYVDDPRGAGMYLADPEGSLLLPPTAGWVSLTGRRAGAPRMSFV